MISIKENVWHISLYLDAKEELKFLNSDWFSLKINLSFSRRLTLKSPRYEDQYVSSH